MRKATASELKATADELRAAESRGIESALADHRSGHAHWPFADSGFGLSSKQSEIQAAWAGAKRARLVSLGYKR